MLNIEEAVRDELVKFINEDALPVIEKSSHKRRPKKHNSNKKNEKYEGGKKAIKTHGGGRKDIDYKKEKKSNPNISKADQSAIERILKSPAINQSAVAKKLYPDHTDNGAQSQLRKKIEGVKSDSGSKYRLKRKEARRLRKIIAKMLNF